MPKPPSGLEGKLARVRAWVKENWQVLLFWLICAFAGWYLGAKGYGMNLYLRLNGIDPRDRVNWDPHLRLTAQKDPKVGTLVSLEGLTDWQGRPIKLPFPDKMTALLFLYPSGMEEELQVFLSFAQRHSDRVRFVLVSFGKPDAEVLQLLSQIKTEVVWARDPQMKVFERLNALYIPRLYLISSDGTLQYLSPLVGRYWGVNRWAEELERLSRRIGR